MKTQIVTIAALLAAMLALPSQARAPQERTAQLPATSLILAQARGDATCPLEGRQVPQGTTRCDAGHVVRCTAQGSWQRTGKAC
ncbi:MAG TPA: hypothetical protein VFP62_07655 [Burkholderiales bacterium]|jgi:hypothetical protein|nr:hypothetical protein [Burkholderiales bacterium]